MEDNVVESVAASPNRKWLVMGGLLVVVIVAAIAFIVWNPFRPTPVTVTIKVQAFGTDCVHSETDLGIYSGSTFSVKAGSNTTLGIFGAGVSGTATNGNGVDVAQCEFSGVVKLLPNQGVYTVSAQGDANPESYGWSQIKAASRTVTLQDNFTGKVYFFADGSNAAGVTVSFSEEVFGVNCADAQSYTGVYTGATFDVTDSRGTQSGSLNQSSDAIGTNGQGQVVDTCTFVGSVVLPPELSLYNLSGSFQSNNVAYSWSDISNSGNTMSAELNFNGPVYDSPNASL